MAPVEGKADTAQKRTPAKLVLIVEDEADQRDSILDILVDEGYRAIGASNGENALSAIAQECPALVLVDLVMPEMDGRELVRRTRAVCKDPPPFVFTTGSQPSKTHDISSEILMKPIDVDRLLSVVARHCGPP
jgi:CheY-like chemotaxis protein